MSSDPSEDVQPDRSSVFFIRFNCEPLKLKSQLESTFESCRFEFEDSESCLVGIRGQQVEKKMAYLNKTDPSLDILTYAQYKKLQQASQRPAKKI